MNSLVITIPDEAEGRFDDPDENRYSALLSLLIIEVSRNS